MGERPRFDPYAILAPLEQRRVTYVLIGSFARVVRGAEESPNGVDLVPSYRGSNLERLQQAVTDLGAVRTDAQPPNIDENMLDDEPVIELATPQGELKVVAAPAGTRGYDDLRRAATREYLGQGLRPTVASTGDLARMLAALGRVDDLPNLNALRRIAQLERSLGHELTR
jgi:hypothetical protein